MSTGAARAGAQGGGGEMSEGGVQVPPCGCSPDMHPGETHAEHMDSLVRRMNEHAIGRILAAPGPWPLWRLALNAVIDDELRRLHVKKMTLEVG